MTSRRFEKITRRAVVSGAVEGAIAATVLTAKTAKAFSEPIREFPLVSSLQKTEAHTLVTPAMLSQLKHNIKEHRWAKEYCAKIVEDAEYWVSFSDERIYAMLPPENPRTYTAGQYVGCPLHGAAPEGTIQTYTTSLDTPYRWRCRVGGEWWYNGAEVINPATGKKIVVRDNGFGWVAPAGFPGEGKTFFFAAAYRSYLFRKLFWEPYGAVETGRPNSSGLTTVVLLALAYHLTGDKRCAHKAHLMLARLAEIYESLDGNWEHHIGIVWKSTDQGHIDDWNFENWHIRNIVLACDLLWDTLAEDSDLVKWLNERNSPTVRYATADDIKKAILTRLFPPMVRFVFNTNYNGQNYLNTRCTLLAIALCSQNEALLHEALDGVGGLRELSTDLYTTDGRYFEDSFSYAEAFNLLMAQWLELLTLARPNQAAWTKPILECLFRFEFDTPSHGRIPTFGDTSNARGVVAWNSRSSLTYWQECAMRQGAAVPQVAGLLTRADRENAYTHPVRNSQGEATQALIRLCAPFPNNSPVERKTQSASLILPEGGLAVLRAPDAKPSQMRLEVPFTFAVTNNHDHADKLSFTLPAFGYELSRDNGYPDNSTAPRFAGWDLHSASHNLVMVDERNQDAGFGKPTLWFSGKKVSLVEARAESVYSIPEYRRFVCRIALPGGGDCILDIFRVVGGKQHDYLFHALASQDGSGLEIESSASLDWKARTGTLAGQNVAWGSEPGYSFLKNVRESQIEGQVQATWRVPDAARTGTRVWFSGKKGETLFHALGEDSGPFGKSPLNPFLIWRRKSRSNEPCQSIFTSVVEPFQGKPRVQRVERVPLTGNDSERSVAVRLVTDIGSVLLVSSPHDSSSIQGKVSEGDFELDGRFGAAFFENGKMTSLINVRAEMWQIGTKRISGPRALAAKVIRVKAPDTLELGVSAVTADNLTDRLLIGNQASARPAALHVRSAQQSGSRVDCKTDSISFLATQFVIAAVNIREGTVATRSVIARQWRVPRLLYGMAVVCKRTGEKFVISKWHTEERQSVFYLTPTITRLRPGDTLESPVIRVGDMVDIGLGSEEDM